MSPPLCCLGREILLPIITFRYDSAKEGSGVKLVGFYDRRRFGIDSGESSPSLPWNGSKWQCTHRRHKDINFVMDFTKNAGLLAAVQSDVGQIDWNFCYPLFEARSSGSVTCASLGWKLELLRWDSSLKNSLPSLKNKNVSDSIKNWKHSHSCVEH